jgi:hypothetical protein
MGLPRRSARIKPAVDVLGGMNLAAEFSLVVVDGVLVRGLLARSAGFSVDGGFPVA